jgi:hypothetical protein
MKQRRIQRVGLAALRVRMHMIHFEPWPGEAFAAPRTQVLPI